MTDQLLASLRAGQYGPDDVWILAMVGERDGTKSAMRPQIEALRQADPALLTDANLHYWENADGGHDEASLIAELA